MHIRRKYITEAKGNKTLQKCLALVLVLKYKVGSSSRIPKYSLNKLCKTAGISHKIAKKYEKYLLDYNLIHFEGTAAHRVLVLNKISSHTSNRNICTEQMDLSSFFTAFRSLQSFIFMRIQHNKDSLRHLLQAKCNPESPKQFRKAKKQVKNLVKQGVLDSVNTQYKEYRLSLKKAAKEVGCCIRTVQRVIEFAISKQWVEKKHHFEWVTAPGVNYTPIEGFTFSTKNALCIVHPNTYSISNTVSKALGFGMVDI